ncbi:ABC transporter permease [Roseospira marina]|uniref:ABC transporter permease n=1 Tax=Roseospira marina TaxID=140057 RepID=A0A5M6I9S8_9PROT|nr:ABC transporter permease [Roseospira marina]KAA5604990.1 ABC transporter permease [Roseospira marina]MBB4315005.1 peptide/nickel transport system permease protein [Roseospira marina]MBB5088005.1 peptide/nickel transport system permease protein [Roseospira marina]
MIRSPHLNRSRLSPAGWVGGGISAVVLGTALLSLVWTPHDPTAMDIAHRLADPSATHPLGTDHFGRDTLSQLMAGARVSIAVSLVAVGLGAGLGVPLGLLAAARRGWLDEAVMRFNDLAFAFPALLTAVLLTALLGPGAINAILAIGVFTIPVFARVTRGAALAIWKRPFIQAARLAGRGRARISVDHILPNIAGSLIVQATIQFAMAILAEAGLSYLGLGSQPPEVSWGRMLNEAQTFLFLDARLAILPGMAIVVTVLGLNLLGDGLRDRLDPRLHARGAPRPNSHVDRI